MPLPVLDVINELKAALKNNPVTILQAPPGAGKSTVVPLRLMNEDWLGDKKIIMLEPRRLATRAVAHRMASLHNDETGRTIGYRVRFENMTSHLTRIEVLTEGILARMIQGDNALEGVGLIIFDEFHERSLHSDLALALGLQTQSILRPDLRILIMSATIDAGYLSKRLHNAPVIESSGRQHPVSIRYVGSEHGGHVSDQAATAIRKALAECQGDILVFLPGSGEIMRTLEILGDGNPGVKVLPLYGDLSAVSQQAAITPNSDGSRKVVLATSIAETSLTIEGISIVIDTGFSRVPRYDAKSGLTRLETEPITIDSADQRAGRAGRLGPGICYRLWNERTHKHLIRHRRPEILDADLSAMMLELAMWGIKEVDELIWIDLPPAGAVSQARELLHRLGALENGLVTQRGRAMARLPTHPRIAHMLIEASADPYHLGLAIDCAAILEERDPLPRQYGADFALRVDELRKFREGSTTAADRIALGRIERLAGGWQRVFRVSANKEAVDHYLIGSLLAYAYPDRIAQRIDRNTGQYKLVTGRTGRLAPDDALVHEPYIVTSHLDPREGGGKIFLAAPIEADVLLGLAVEMKTVKWDDRSARIIASIEIRIGNIVLEQRPLKEISTELRLNVLYDTIREKGLGLVGWSEAHEDWQARVMSLRQWRSSEPWPDVSDSVLLQTLPSWLGPYLTEEAGKSDLERLDLLPILNAMLPWELQSVFERLAPARIRVPSGSYIRVQYDKEGKTPVLAVRMQEVFGWVDTPRINNGATAVLLHLLSPGYRVMQVTSDLKSFWNSGYNEVRKELRRRYPKHHWPEDPATAQAVRGVRR